MDNIEKLLDKILPEKHRLLDPSDSQGNWLGETCRYHKSDGYNQALSDIRQRLLSTYGKEWVGVPSVDQIEEILERASSDENERLKWVLSWMPNVKTGNTKVIKSNVGYLAESILKGLRGE